MKKMNVILKKCKSLQSRLGRSSSYSSLRSKSTREEDDPWCGGGNGGGEEEEEERGRREAVVLVGTSRRPYMISYKHLSHPLLNALIEISKLKSGGGGGGGGGANISVKCEVVLFDHLLWMIENADPEVVAEDSLEELANLYAC